MSFNLKRSFFVIFLVCLLGDPAGAWDNLAIASWGDYVFWAGPETDYAMDTPEGIHRLMRRLKARGYSGFLHRAVTADLDPCFIVRNERLEDGHPASAHLDAVISAPFERFQVTRVLRKAADEAGLEFWVWWPTVFSDGGPPDLSHTPAPGEYPYMSWQIEHRYVHDNREVLSVDRDGLINYAVREYAYPGARRTKVDEFVYLAREHGVRNFVACMRTENYQMQPPPEHADQFGFNAPVVHDMRSLHGVDILTDPRFDWRCPDYDLHDPMVENWRRLRGTYLTKFFRELRERLSEVDPEIRIAVQFPGGDYAGPTIGNLKLDWRTWIDEGLVDVLIPNVCLSDWADRNSPAKGYLTNRRGSVGVHPPEVFREYIDRSAHPGIRLIMAGGRRHIFAEPPSGADGWRTDITQEAFTYAWFQRWQDWKRDLAEFGHIRFLVQDFNAFEPYSTGRFRGMGRGRYYPGRYYPGRRSCEGLWYAFGDSSDDRPVVQEAVSATPGGRAVKLTRGPEGPNALRARHLAGKDRAMVGGCIANAMSGGRMIFRYRLYLGDENSSLITSLHFHYRASDLRLLVAPGGIVRYRRNGTWQSSRVRLEPGQWHEVVMEIDGEEATWSAHAGGQTICEQVPYQEPAHINYVMFVPQPPEGNISYIDDVQLLWTPELFFAAMGEEVRIEDTFESHAPGAMLHGAQAEGGTWRVDGKAEHFTVHQNTSFGKGFHSLLARGPGRAAIGGLPPVSAGRLLLDFDVFIPSSRPTFRPGTESTSDHAARIGVQDDAGGMIFGVHAAARWRLWNGRDFVDSGLPMQYDVWNRVQVKIDLDREEGELVVQPVGELPRSTGRLPLEGGERGHNQRAWQLFVETSDSEGHISFYDNIRLSGTRFQP